MSGSLLPTHGEAAADPGKCSCRGLTAWSSVPVPESPKGAVCGSLAAGTLDAEPRVAFLCGM